MNVTNQDVKMFTDHFVGGSSLNHVFMVMGRIDWNPAMWDRIEEIVDGEAVWQMDDGADSLLCCIRPRNNPDAQDRESILKQAETVSALAKFWWVAV